MCGIVGIITKDGEKLAAILSDMNDALVHRGPDEEGLLSLPTEGVGLAMRRLSILDIEGGRQPMWDESRSHAVVFNGEIYNYAALRAELLTLGHSFVTDHSDTEVLVHGYEQWGVDLFPRLNGMFAFAIWDVHHRRLVVARDRMGEKPLYIASTGNGYAIGSEIKAVLRHPDVPRVIDPKGLDQFLSFDYIFGPRTILQSVKKLPAGCYAFITPDVCQVEQYWRMDFSATPITDERRAIEGLDSLLDDSVRMRMVADVPVGLFLSGGLDSTTIGYYMRRHSDRVMSFSIGFEQREYDESAYAQMAADHLGTIHHLEVFSEDRIRDLVPQVAELLDEPMADQSIFPMLLLSQMTRAHVKVALGGDGSDELLMGYTAYQQMKLCWQFDRLPAGVRRLVSATARRTPTHVLGTRLRGRKALGRLDLPPNLRLVSSLGAFGGNARWIMGPQLRASLSESVMTEVSDAFLASDGTANSAADETIAAYVRGYLQENILAKVDRASMAASLEVRAPFLDPVLIDFLARVPASLKMKGLERKHLLRKLMRGRLPDSIVDRPKRGFGAPVNAWLRTSLAPLLQDYLAPSRIAEEGLLDTEQVQRLVTQHVGGTADYGAQLWPILLFELWRERWIDGVPSA